jgi:asparagine synthase (glutamine-hydrolysing)
MSAIAGILYFHGAPVPDGLIEKLTYSMKTRGPDAQAVWRNGSIALGHCMLHATPESLVEKQPLASLDGQLTIVWDGRLDNRDELYADLKGRGARFRDHSDAELALVAYEYYGEKTPEKFLGDFAFAVWNARTQSLFLARDHVGARPFYYVRTEKFFAFASEDEVLLCIPEVRRLVSIDRLAYTLLPAPYIPDLQQSWLEDVRMFRPCSWLTIDVCSRARTERSNTSFSAPRFSGSHADAVAAFADVFTLATKARARSIQSVGMLLSGGVDSACVAKALHDSLGVARQDTNTIRAFSCLSSNTPDDVESNSILKMHKRLGIESNFITLEQYADPAERPSLDRLVRLHTHPIDFFLVLQGLLCVQARERGTNVLLHGVSGDLVADAPYRYLFGYLSEFGISRACTEFFAATRNHTYVARPAARNLLSHAIRDWLGAGPLKLLRRRKQCRRSRREPFSGASLQLSESLNYAVVQSNRLSAHFVNTAEHPRDRQAVDVGSLTIGLEGYERVAGKFGIEFRDPFADVRVIRFFNSLPNHLRVQLGYTKFVLRQYANESFADTVWRSDKQSVASSMTQLSLDVAKSHRQLQSESSQHWKLEDDFPHSAVDAFVISSWAKERALRCSTMLVE